MYGANPRAVHPGLAGGPPRASRGGAGGAAAGLLGPAPEGQSWEQLPALMAKPLAQPYCGGAPSRTNASLRSAEPGSAAGESGGDSCGALGAVRAKRGGGGFPLRGGVRVSSPSFGSFLLAVRSPLNPPQPLAYFSCLFA